MHGPRPFDLLVFSLMGCILLFHYYQHVNDPQTVKSLCCFSGVESNYPSKLFERLNGRLPTEAMTFDQLKGYCADYHNVSCRHLTEKEQKDTDYSKNYHYNVASYCLDTQTYCYVANLIA
jgi:hypothetical protein